MSSVHRQWDINVSCIACMHKSLHYNHVFTQPLKLKDVLANIHIGNKENLHLYICNGMVKLF